MGKAVNPVWVQGHYRYENDDGTLDGSTFIDAQDTTITQNADENFRLRINWGESANQNQGTSLTPQLQFNINGGTWTTVGSATAVQYKGSSNETDNNTGTERLTTAPTGCATYTQTYFDDNNTLAAQSPADAYYELSFNLYIDSAQVSDNDTINFQLVDGAATETFTTRDTNPSLTVNVAGPILQSVSGSITATGDLDKLAWHLLSGTITATGELIRRTQTLLAGSITSSGVVTSSLVFLQTVTGSITAAGQLVNNVIVKILSGSITSTGALIKTASINLVGSITASGIVQKAITLGAKLGSITASGALTLQLTLSKLVTGTITSLGALAALFIPGGGPPSVSRFRSGSFMWSKRRRRKK